MPEFSLHVLENEEECKDAITLKFLKPQIDYKAGQYLMYSLPVEDPKGNIRPFSLASSPTEDFLLFTTKLTGSVFKNTLATLKKGDVINARGPFGKFVLENSPKHLMIAGGIGITPFRSMIKYAVDTKTKQQITLLYSNKIPEEIAYRDELEKWQKQNKFLRVIQTITRPEESNEQWSGRTGRIDDALIKEHSDVDTMFYVCGPPGMVDAMLELLKQIGIPEERIRLERFAGY